MALNITDENYKELIQSGAPVVIDFWAQWCGPCKRISPIMDELADEYQGKAQIGKCDTEDNDAVCTEFGIMSLPTILYFKGGALVDKVVGAASKEVIKAKIEAIL